MIAAADATQALRLAAIASLNADLFDWFERVDDLCHGARIQIESPFNPISALAVSLLDWPNVKQNPACTCGALSPVSPSSTRRVGVPAHRKEV